MNKIIGKLLLIVIGNFISYQSHAALINGSTLNIGSGSYWELETGGNTFVTTSIIGNNGLVLGTSQLSSGWDHIGGPNGSEIPGIDEAALFIASTAMHQTTSNVEILSQNTTGGTLDFSGWNWIWAQNSHLMNTGAWNGNSDGVANIVCGLDCSNGDTYTLTYSAAVPLASPSGIGGERYNLVLNGTISAVPLPSSLWLMASALSLLSIRRRKVNEI